MKTSDKLKEFYLRLQPHIVGHRSASNLLSQAIREVEEMEKEKPKYKHVWFNRYDGTFSNSFHFSPEEVKKAMKDREELIKLQLESTCLKLIEYRVLPEGDSFEFSDYMKIVSNKRQKE